MAKENDANRYRMEAEYARTKVRMAIADERTAWRQIAEGYELLESLSRAQAQPKRTAEA
jgi:hypothetical protein